MKTEFPGFYRPSPKEFSRLWREGLIVVDTNVLLNVYRFPPDARKDLLKVFEHFSSRLWIPHQVAAEFQRNRVTAIQEQRKSLSALRRLVTEAPGKINAELLRMEIARRTGVDVKEYTEQLRALHAGIDAAIETALAEQQSTSLDDPIRDQLDSLFAGKVGPAPQDQVYLDALYKLGETRYALRRPPGFKDAADKKDLKYVLKGLLYQAQYGDFLIWQQLLDHVAANKVKAVLFVTSDTKDDWWQVIDGKTIGPQPELVEEIRRGGVAGLFWMYEVSSFLKYAQEIGGAKINEQSIQEARNVEREPQDVEQIAFLDENALEAASSGSGDLGTSQKKNQLLGLYELGAKVPIYDWLGRLFPDGIVEMGGAFDFLVRLRGAAKKEPIRHAFQVKRLTRRHLGGSLEDLTDVLLHGQMATLGEIDRFTLVLIAPPASLRQLQRIEETLRSKVDSDPDLSVVVGVIRGKNFHPVFSPSFDDNDLIG